MKYDYVFFSIQNRSLFSYAHRQFEITSKSIENERVWIYANQKEILNIFSWTDRSNFFLQWFLKRICWRFFEYPHRINSQFDYRTGTRRKLSTTNKTCKSNITRMSTICTRMMKYCNNTCVNQVNTVVSLWPPTSDGAVAVSTDCQVVTVFMFSLSLFHLFGVE